MASAHATSTVLVALAARARGSDGAGALEELLERLRGPVQRFVLGRGEWPGDAADFAADVMQETLIRVAAHLEKCRATTDEQLLAWVLTIARREALRMLQDARTLLAVRAVHADLDRAASAEAVRLWTGADGDEGPGEPDPDEVLVRVLADVYDAEGVTAGRLVRMHVVDGAPWAEVAVLLGTTPAAAKRRFQRSLRRLRSAVLRRVSRLPDEARTAALDALRQRAEGGPDGPA